MLDIRKKMSEIRDRYKTNPSRGSLNILLLGESGSGKTFLCRTAPGPVHIDCFDKGAATNLAKWVETGHVIPDDRWEEEDPMNPRVFELWKKEMGNLIKANYFDYIGTYVLDSATTFGEAVMNQILKNAGIPGQAPRFTHDFTPQKTIVMNWIRALLNLPCNTIITGHLATQRDEVSGKLQRRFMMTGQASTTIPLKFDEIWVMDPKETSKGTEYRILTKSTDKDLARSRLAQDGLLDKYEEPDITKLMNKVKWPIRKPKQLEGE